MSKPNRVYEVSQGEGSCSLAVVGDELNMNGDLCGDKLTPNNNLCDIVSSGSPVENEADFNPDDSVSPESESEPREESDNWSANQSIDPSPVHEDSTHDTDGQLSDPYNFNNEKSLDDDFLMSPSDHNGTLKKSYRKKKMSSGPGRGRPRKALVAMYHSQISGDKNAIKIRIKKSCLTTQVNTSFI